MGADDKRDALAEAFAREVLIEMREMRASIDRLAKAVLLDAQAKLVSSSGRGGAATTVMDLAGQIANLLRNLRL